MARSEFAASSASRRHKALAFSPPSLCLTSSIVFSGEVRSDLASPRSDLVFPISPAPSLARSSTSTETLASPSSPALHTCVPDPAPPPAPSFSQDMEEPRARVRHRSHQAPTTVTITVAVALRHHHRQDFVSWAPTEQWAGPVTLSSRSQGSNRSNYNTWPKSKPSPEDNRPSPILPPKGPAHPAKPEALSQYISSASPICEPRASTCSPPSRPSVLGFPLDQTATQEGLHL